jgi:hypothetical protein
VQPGRVPINGTAFGCLGLCLTLAVASASANPAAAEEPGESAPQFALSSAFQAAEQIQATGLYILGTTRIRTWTATHYVLMRDGRGVQIHTHANGAWLQKLEGSSGGLLIGVAKFDELLSIAGGVNRNAKELPAEARDRFYCLAGFGDCRSTAPPVAGRTRASEPSGALPPPLAITQLLLPLVGDAQAKEGPCPGCQPYFTLGEGARTLGFGFEAATRRMMFEGWGIRASWLVPPPDEI